MATVRIGPGTSVSICALAVAGCSLLFPVSSDPRPQSDAGDLPDASCPRREMTVARTHAAGSEVLAVAFSPSHGALYAHGTLLGVEGGSEISLCHPATAIAVDGNFAYLALGAPPDSRGFQVVDLQRPELEWCYETRPPFLEEVAAAAVGVAVSSTRSEVVVALSCGGFDACLQKGSLLVFDVSSTGAVPAPRAFLHGCSATSVVPRDGTYVFAGCGLSNGVEIVDLVSMEPTLIQLQPADYPVVDVARLEPVGGGDEVVIGAAGMGGLARFRFDSFQAEPLNIPGLALLNPQRIAFAGETLLVLDVPQEGSSLVHAIDFRDPADPRHVHSLEVPASHDLATADLRALLATNDGALELDLGCLE